MKGIGPGNNGLGWLNPHQCVPHSRNMLAQQITQGWRFAVTGGLAALGPTNSYEAFTPESFF